MKLQTNESKMGYINAVFNVRLHLVGILYFQFRTTFYTHFISWVLFHVFSSRNALFEMFVELPRNISVNIIQKIEFNWTTLSMFPFKACVPALFIHFTHLIAASGDVFQFRCTAEVIFSVVFVFIRFKKKIDYFFGRNNRNCTIFKWILI